VGLKQEDAVAYRETRRDDRTGQSQRADQVYDRWVDRSQYWSATQALGYRWQDGWWTVSVRWTRDELVHANHHAKVEELRSDDPDLSSEGRSVVRQSMSLLAGVALP
jgi:hypothetical protein